MLGSWKFLLERDFPEAIQLLDDTFLLASSVVYRCLYSATLSLKKKKEKGLSTQLGELEGQSHESEYKFLVENTELQQRVDNLRSKLFTLQTDQEPREQTSRTGNL